MRTLNISIALQENGTTGFLMKDITDVQETGFAPDKSDVNSEWLRVNDIVFLDFVTYNKIDEPNTESFIYPVNSLDDYRTYSLDYKSKKDGWYTISHIVIPKLSWFTSINKQYITDGTYYLYDNTTASFTKAIKNESLISYEENIDPYLIYVALENPTVIGVEEEIFIIGRLEKCFEDKIKSIIYGNLYTKCQTTKNRDTIFRDRDVIWMTLEILKYLIRYCKYSEAERILEMVDSCNGFCNGNKFKDRYNFNKGCNCGS